MKARHLTAAIGCVALLAAIPALSQSLGLDQRVGPGAVGNGIDANRGRFLAFGGLFGDLRIGCVRCHELDGSGSSSGAFPRLSDQAGWYLYKSLKDYAAGRLAHLLLEIRHRLHIKGFGNGDTVPCPLSQEDIADCTGLTMPYVNRILRQMRERELVRLDHHTLQILDPGALGKIAGFSSDYLYKWRDGYCSAAAREAALGT